MTPADRAAALVAALAGVTEPDLVAAVIAREIAHAVDQERHACLRACAEVMAAKRQAKDWSAHAGAGDAYDRIAARWDAKPGVDLVVMLRASVAMNDGRKGSA